MADKNMPTRSSNMEKAEGDRDTARINANVDWSHATPEGGGITNRPLDEEADNQQRVPDRGDTRGAGHPKGENTDPVMPDDDSTLNTKI